MNCHKCWARSVQIVLCNFFLYVNNIQKYYSISSCVISIIIVFAPTLNHNYKQTYFTLIIPFLNNFRIKSNLFARLKKKKCSYKKQYQLLLNWKLPPFLHLYQQPPKPKLFFISPFLLHCTKAHHSSTQRQTPWLWTMCLSYWFFHVFWQMQLEQRTFPSSQNINLYQALK